MNDIETNEKYNSQIRKRIRDDIRIFSSQSQSRKQKKCKLDNDYRMLYKIHYAYLVKQVKSILKGKDYPNEIFEEKFKDLIDELLIIKNI